MSNKANCSTCKYKSIKLYKQEQLGHCYMFRHEPDDTCQQWSLNTLLELAESLPEFRTALMTLNRLIK